MGETKKTQEEVRGAIVDGFVPFESELGGEPLNDDDIERLESRISKETRALELHAQFIRLASPAYILKRGYSLTLREGKILKSAAEVRPGDRLTTRFADGEVESTV